MTDADIQAAAQTSKAWPFEEARKLLKRFPEGRQGAPMLFETGYGPSGLPHIGTFQEVLRTTLVRRAYEVLSGGAPTRLVAFSDDMDGLRKVPDNVPNQGLLTAHIGHPLSRIPDPFERFESFAHHNNAMLREFLDRFGFDYEFVSASERYNSGGFDGALKNVLRNYDKIMGVMLPTLREERRKTYSPVLPISPTTGQVLQVPVEVVDAEAGLVRFEDLGKTVEHCIFGGKAKLQWKVDWAMRWVDLGVDYEMCGKDLTDSVTQSGKIAKILGGRRPEGLIYELFLDDKGEKISKSKGNGLTIEQWLTYGSEESLGFYLFREPKSAKQLHIGIIPRAIDEYWQFREKLPGQPIEQQLGNPVWHLLQTTQGIDTAGSLPDGAGDKLPVTYGLLLNLVGVLGAGATRDQVWSYLGNYVDDADPAAHPDLDLLIGRALAYNRDFIAPTLRRRKPDANEAAALAALDEELAGTSEDAKPEDLQTIVYEIGKDPHFGFEQLRDWFKALYETLLGSSQGPRMGSFITLYGVENTRGLIAEALDAQSGKAPEQLAKELLGRRFDELDAEEQNVLRRISAGSVIGLDADEEATLHASFGERLADRVAAVGGSWGFIIFFAMVLVAWILINSRVLEAFGLHAFDAYPYIFLNLMLSMLAAIQAPVIMMSQNRQSAKDRVSARHDYEVNLRTQLEIIRLQRRFDRLLARLEENGK